MLIHFFLERRSWSRHSLLYSCRNLRAAPLSLFRVSSVSFVFDMLNSLIWFIAWFSFWALTKSSWLMVGSLVRGWKDRSVEVVLSATTQATPLRWAAWLPAHVACTNSSESYSVHTLPYLSISRGRLDRVSASTLHFPGLYLMSKWKSESSPTYLWRTAFNFAVLMTWFRGLLSV